MNLKMRHSFIFFIFSLVSCKSLIVNPAPQLSSPLKQYTISQKFATVWNASHQGIDLKANRGTPVLSSHSGKVVYAGKRLSGYGYTVIIEYSEDWSTLYAHLNEIKTQEGTNVLRGSVIGTVGRTGKATGDHLHFELMHKKQPVNPLPYLYKSL